MNTNRFNHGTMNVEAEGCANTIRPLTNTDLLSKGTTMAPANSTCANDSAQPNKRNFQLMTFPTKAEAVVVA